MYKIILIIGILCTYSQLFAEEYELSKAQQSGVVSVQLIASNEKAINFVIENKTDRPITLRLPTSFAAVPVLAQNAGFGNGGIQPMNNGVGFGSGGIGNNTQRLGGGAQPNNNLFGIKSKGKRVIKINTVCLDFGLKIPNTNIRYELVSIKDIAYDDKLNKVIAGLADDRVSQKVAQIVAWHIHNHTSLTDIANTGTFSDTDMVVAQRFIEQL